MFQNFEMLIWTSIPLYLPWLPCNANRWWHLRYVHDHMLNIVVFVCISPDWTIETSEFKVFIMIKKFVSLCRVDRLFFMPMLGWPFGGPALGSVVIVPLVQNLISSDWLCLINPKINPEVSSSLREHYNLFIIYVFMRSFSRTVFSVELCCWSWGGCVLTWILVGISDFSGDTQFRPVHCLCCNWLSLQEKICSI